MFLADLTLDELEAEAAKDISPKWKSMCLLRSIGAPTLNAMLLDEKHGARNVDAICRSIDDFCMRTKVQKVMVRTDRVRETSDYLRGGNSYSAHDAIEVVMRVLELGRTVILLEPTDRLANTLTISIAVEGNGSWRAEILGPGFDASNLQRGDVVPEFFVQGHHFDRSRLFTGRELQMQIKEECSVDMNARVQARLSGIVQHILPSYGVDLRDSADALADAETWMRQNGYTLLFRTKSVPVSPRALSAAIEISQLAYHHRMNRNKTTSFVVSFSVLRPLRYVFWDITDGAAKWGAARNAAM